MRIKMYYPEAFFEKKQKAYCFELLKVAQNEFIWLKKYRVRT